MKKTLSFSLFLATTFFANAQNISINNTGASPDASAMLDISSNNKGLLIPRMTKGQRAAITLPKNGLIVYDSSTASFWFYKQNQWQELASNNSTSDSSLIYGQQAGSIVSYNLDATTHNTIVSDSSGFIYDSGGPGGNYGNNEDYAIAIYSSITNIIGYKIQVLNNNLENPFDTLSITYGGANPVVEILTGTQTGTYTLDNSPVIIRFKSNATNTAAGFKIRWDVILPPASSANNAPMAGWYFTPGKLAMHGGYNYNNQWSDANSGFSSFNYGYGNNATGDYSTALGYYTKTVGKYAIAIGRTTSAWGDHSIAMGYDTYSSGNASTTFGYNTFAGGDYSTAFGYNTFATDYLATAWGMSTSASGYNSTAFGSFTSASNNNAVAFGSQSQASGDGATAIGSNVYASGINSTSIGSSTTASGDHSMALGSRVSTNSMAGSFAIGDAVFYAGSLNNDAPNQMMMRFAGGYKFYLNDVTMGMSVDANGQVGIGTASPLAGLHVTDNSVLFSATGNIPGSPASIPIQGAGRRSMWYADKAAFRTGYVDGVQWNQSNTGNYSFGAGMNTIASGLSSVSIGSGTTASGTYSIAIGESVTAKSAYEMVVGRWNTDYTPVSTNGWNPTDRLFVVGNGTNFGASSSDALTVLKNGNIGIGKSNPVHKLHIVNASSGATPFSSGFTPLVVENNGHTYINLISPETSETAILFGKPSNAAHGVIMYNNASNTNGFQFRVNGNITKFEIFSNGNATLQGTLTQTSDARLKKDIHPLQNSLFKLSQLTGYSYYWKNKDADPGLQTGILAQEVQKIFPQLVAANKQGILSVNYSGLIPVMIEGIKEQQQQISELTKVATTQQQQIDELKKMVEKLLRQ